MSSFPVRQSQNHDLLTEIITDKGKVQNLLTEG